jgi:hypothetical protein
MGHAHWGAGDEGDETVVEQVHVCWLPA